MHRQSSKPEDKTKTKCVGVTKIPIPTAIHQPCNETIRQNTVHPNEETKDLQQNVKKEAILEVNVGDCAVI